MNILHTEASNGWGGQEIRILREAEGMRERGYAVFFAVIPGGRLAQKAREAHFTVYEVPLKIKQAPIAIYHLLNIIHRHQIDIVITHSSADAWLGGIAGKLSRCGVIRTRHLSTPITKGWNSRLLYNTLADYTVTTCGQVANTIREQARLPPHRCRSIPTGVDPKAITIDKQQVFEFRKRWNISPSDYVVGTLCVLRSWKGIPDLLKAAQILQKEPHIKWMIVGDGPGTQIFREEAHRLGVQHRVIFTGHLTPPYCAIGAMDIFTLLSTAHEGVSQSSLQAAYLEKPLITTPVGGLPEVCIDKETGFIVPISSPEAVADRVLMLSRDPDLRLRMGKKAHELVTKRFTFDQTLSEMEAVFSELKRPLFK